MAITGMFCILAGHQHYSIDILIAWVLSSRLFIYYHTWVGRSTDRRISSSLIDGIRFSCRLANNRIYLQRDKSRMRIWFPFFSYFEENVKQAVPNEYSLPTCFGEARTKIHGCMDRLRYPSDWFIHWSRIFVVCFSSSTTSMLAVFRALSYTQKINVSSSFSSSFSLVRVEFILSYTC